MLHPEQVAAFGKRPKALGEGTTSQANWGAMDFALFKFGDAIAGYQPETAQAGLRCDSLRAANVSKSIAPSSELAGLLDASRIQKVRPPSPNLPRANW